MKDIAYSDKPIAGIKETAETPEVQASVVFSPYKVEAGARAVAGETSTGLTSVRAIRDRNEEIYGAFRPLRGEVLAKKVARIQKRTMEYDGKWVIDESGIAVLTDGNF